MLLAFGRIIFAVGRFRRVTRVVTIEDDIVIGEIDILDAHEGEAESAHGLRDRLNHPRALRSGDALAGAPVADQTEFAQRVIGLLAGHDAPAGNVRSAESADAVPLLPGPILETGRHVHDDFRP